MTTPAAPADFLWASSENEVKCLTQDDAREEKLFECRVFNHTGQFALIITWIFKHVYSHVYSYVYSHVYSYVD